MVMKKVIIGPKGDGRKGDGGGDGGRVVNPSYDSLATGQ